MKHESISSSEARFANMPCTIRHSDYFTRESTVRHSSPCSFAKGSPAVCYCAILAHSADSAKTASCVQVEAVAENKYPNSF